MSGAAWSVCDSLPTRATAPGLFVAPGSIGLLLGMILGTFGDAATAPLIAIALITCLLLARVGVPPPCPTRNQQVRHTVRNSSSASFSCRSSFGPCSGSWSRFPGKRGPVELILLTVATVAGKAFGGILADRWGWIRVGVGSMLAAAPLLAWASTYPVAAIAGLLLLNLTMAVTLVAVSEAVPGYPGFSFGLTCLALLLGALPRCWASRSTAPSL